MENSEKITIRLPEKYMKWMDFLVEIGDSPTKSAIIHEALRNYLYDRLTYVMEKTREIEEAESKLSETMAFNEKYLQK